MYVFRAVRLKDGREEDPQDESEGPVQFRHDMKLLIPSPIYHTNEQVMLFFFSFVFLSYSIYLAYVCFFFFFFFPISLSPTLMHLHAIHN